MTAGLVGGARRLPGGLGAGHGARPRSCRPADGARNPGRPVPRRGRRRARVGPAGRGGDRHPDRPGRGRVAALRPRGAPAARTATELGLPRAGAGVLGAASYEEACAVSRAVCGKGLSKQLYNILGKIREVDELLSPRLQRQLFEACPELSFAVLSGGEPMRHTKRTCRGTGRARRGVATRSVRRRRTAHRRRPAGRAAATTSSTRSSWPGPPGAPLPATVSGWAVRSTDEACGWRSSPERLRSRRRLRRRAGARAPGVPGALAGPRDVAAVPCVARASRSSHSGSARRGCCRRKYRGARGARARPRGPELGGRDRMVRWSFRWPSSPAPTSPARPLRATRPRTSRRPRSPRRPGRRRARA